MVHIPHYSLGWGRTWNKTTPRPPVINAINIDIYDEAECQKKYPKRKLNFTNQLCAGKEVSMEEGIVNECFEFQATRSKLQTFCHGKLK